MDVKNWCIAIVVIVGVVLTWPALTRIANGIENGAAAFSIAWDNMNMGSRGDVKTSNYSPAGYWGPKQGTYDCQDVDGVEWCRQ